MRRLRGTLTVLEALRLSRELNDVVAAISALGTLLSGTITALSNATTPTKKRTSSRQQKKSSARVAGFGKRRGRRLVVSVEGGADRL